jgi:hypothetical protein
VVGWLTGWRHRKRCTVSGCAGAGSNYQFPLTVYYGSGTDSGASVYLDALCRLDFSDIRFTTSDGETLLSYWLKSKTDGSNAIFWVKDSESLEADNTIYLYYGNPVKVASLSSQTDTFIDTISGVVGAWNMEEANAADPLLDSSGNTNNGTPTGTDIVTGPYSGKNARGFVAVDSDFATVTDDAALHVDGTDKVSILAWIKLSEITDSLRPIVEASYDAQRQAYYLCLSGKKVLGACWNANVQKHRYGATTLTPTWTYYTISSTDSVKYIHDLIFDSDRNCTWGVTRSDADVNYIFSADKNCIITKTALGAAGKKRGMMLCQANGKFWMPIMADAGEHNGGLIKYDPYTDSVTFFNPSDSGTAGATSIA